MRTTARRVGGLWLGCAIAFAAGGCAGSRTGSRATAAAPSPPPALSPPPAVAPAPAAPAPSPVVVPAGFVEMTVLGVGRHGGDNAVMLVDAARRVFVPIFIGGTEALSIVLRHERRRFERPLTHDLLDAVLRELGGELLKVHVDALKGDRFVGTVYVRHAGRVAALDARASDAIALALGSRVPIFVAREVIDTAGIRPDARPDASPERGPPPGGDKPRAPRPPTPSPETKPGAIDDPI